MTRSQPTDDADKPAGKRFGCLLYTACLAALVLLALGLAYFIWYSDARSELDGEIARILERGEPLWFADLEPKTATPPEDDATALFLLAMRKLMAPNQAFNDLITAEPDTEPGEIGRASCRERVYVLV